METFGQRLRLLRMKKGLTQSQIAKGIVTPSMVSQIEANKARPSYHVLERIAQKLETSLDELIGNVHLNLRIDSEYRLAKSMLVAGEFSGALPLLEKVVQENEGSLDPFEIRFDLAYCQLHLNQLDEAEVAFKNFVEGSNLTTIQQVRVLQQLGQIEIKRKRYQIGEHYLSLALEKLENNHSKDIQLQASLLLMLGDLQKQSGQLQQSMENFQLALPILKQREDIKGLGTLYMQLAQTAHEAQEFEQASDYAKRAQWCFEEFQSQLDKLAFTLRYAVLQAEMGNVDDAIITMEDVAEQFRKRGKEEEAGVASVELAKLYLLRGRLDQAEEASRTGRTLLPNLHPYQAWGARVQAGVAERRNQGAVAVKYLKQAADCFKFTECQAEYEETMQELSRLYESQEDAKGALYVMREMWSYSLQIRGKRGIVL